MYLARFCYDIAPIDRERALALIRKEVTAAQSAGLAARLLVPLTRPPHGAALQFELEVPSLDDLESFRHRGNGHGDDMESWARELSEILAEPPSVEILRIAEESIGDEDRQS